MLGRKLLKLLRRKHALKSIHQRRKRYRKLDVVGQPAEVLECVGHALQEMWFALVEAAKSVRPQRLHDAHIHVGVVVLHERAAIDGNEFRKAIEIVAEQFFAQRWRQVRFPVVEQRRNVILQRSFAAPW